MTIDDEVEAIKRMTPEQLAKAVAELSPEDRKRLDERMRGRVQEALTRYDEQNKPQ